MKFLTVLFFVLILLTVYFNYHNNQLWMFTVSSAVLDFLIGIYVLYKRK